MLFCPVFDPVYSGFQFRASCQKTDRQGGRLTGRTKLKTALIALVINQCLHCGSKFHVCATARTRSHKRETCYNPVEILSILAISFERWTEIKLIYNILYLH